MLVIERGPILARRESKSYLGALNVTSRAESFTFSYEGSFHVLRSGKAINSEKQE